METAAERRTRISGSSIDRNGAESVASDHRRTDFALEGLGLEHALLVETLDFGRAGPGDSLSCRLP